MNDQADEAESNKDSDFWITSDLQPLTRPVGKATLQPDNTREHPDRNLDTIEKSFRNFGQRKPIIVNQKTGYIEAGNAMYQVATERLGAEKMAMVFVEDSEEDAKSFEIVDNKSQDLSYFSDELLTEAFEELESEDVDLEVTGFDDLELRDYGIGKESGEEGESEDDTYTDKIEPPTYEPTREEQPAIDELLNKEKFRELVQKIEEADIPEDRRKFLKLTAYRHVVFNYENIAEFYAHATPAVQELMEDLALVIIDFEKSIEKGFTQYNREVLENE